MAITVADVQPAESARSSSDVTPLATTMGSVSASDVMIAVGQTWDTTASAGAASGGSQTWNPLGSIAPGGFRTYGRMDGATMAAGVASSFSVTQAAPSTGCYHNLTTLRLTGAQLAATPVVSSSNAPNSLPSWNITTTAANSMIVALIGDGQSVNPATDAYLLSGTVRKLFDYHTSSDGVYRVFTVIAPTAGVYTIGMSAPTGQYWVGLAVEVLAAATSAGSLVVPRNPSRGLTMR